jgi:hypothetical protein
MEQITQFAETDESSRFWARIFEEEGMIGVETAGNFISGDSIRH